MPAKRLSLFSLTVPYFVEQELSRGKVEFRAARFLRSLLYTGILGILLLQPAAPRAQAQAQASCKFKPSNQRFRVA
jgi:hypothetical protein